MSEKIISSPKAQLEAFRLEISKAELVERLAENNGIAVVLGKTFTLRPMSLSSLSHLCKYQDGDLFKVLDCD